MSTVAAAGGGVAYMILTDGVHLVSDASIEELHAFARKLGLLRIWFQDKPGKPHYDIMRESTRSKALALGAVMVTSKELRLRMVR